MFRRHIAIGLLSSTCLAPTALVAAEADGPTGVPMEEIHITATRTPKSAKTIPAKISVFTAPELRLQQALSTNPVEMLSNLLPSFSPSRQKLTGSGETFRGRSPLFLIDGIPQSNPLRDGSRDGVTIDMEVVERIEVLHGANAIQGLGASGGIINYITVQPPKSGDLEQRASLAATINDDFDGNGFGWRAHYLAAKRFGAVDAMAAVSYEERGLMYDGENRAIALDNTQGDIADSDSLNLFAKVGYEPDENQRVQLTTNRFHIGQNGKYISLPGDPDSNLPPISVKGDPEGDLPENDVLTMTLDYSHKAAFGGHLAAQVFYQDFSGLFGGGAFETFQDPDIAPIGTLFDQSENNSKKFGTRLTYAKNGLFSLPVDLMTGFDFLRDKTFQRLVQTDRNWVPASKFYNYAPFAQLDVAPLDWVTISGGLRWEFATLDVPDYVTVAGNRADFEKITVAGGKPNFDRRLYNIGMVVNPLPYLSLYGTYSESFTIPDVGRVLRGVKDIGTDINTLLTLEPVITNNLEWGGSIEQSWGSLRVAYYESDSNFGSRLVPNADGIFQVTRQATEVHGWEVSGSVTPTAWFDLGLSWSRLNGRFDSDGDGRVDSDLGGANIGPNRINAYVDFTPEGPFSVRLQSFTYLDRTYHDDQQLETAQFDGYTIVDAVGSVTLGPGDLSLSISNLFDKSYISFNGQAVRRTPENFFAGRGRTFTLRYAARF